MRRSRALAGSIALGVLGLSYLRFQRDIADARRHSEGGSTMVATASGPIECAQIGHGEAVLVVHGAGGGYDQGLMLARPLVRQGFGVIAMSRFGYLRTPLPADASPQAQADAHAALLDALNVPRAIILGVSAGAPSSMQFAIRHPTRCTALVLMVPLVWKPEAAPDSVPRAAPWTQAFLEQLMSSDLAYWLMLRLTPNTVIKRVLGTPPALVAAASASEQGRVDEILHGILPISTRAAGLRNEGRVAAALARYELEKIEAPTLVISARDDGYGTFAGAKYTAEHIRGARFIGYEHGGHLAVGHGDEMLGEVAAFVRQHVKATM
jgi:pimeloyl-ACP methyl ester carboxylesterase